MRYRMHEQHILIHIHIHIHIRIRIRMNISISISINVNVNIINVNFININININFFVETLLFLLLEEFCYLQRPEWNVDVSELALIIIVIVIVISLIFDLSSAPCALIPPIATVYGCAR